MSTQGLIHIYCGDGKGKTTAALGLALRCAGSGKRVYFLQFLKGSPTSELAILNQIPQITVQRNSKDFGFSFSMTPKEKQAVSHMHNENLKAAMLACQQGAYELLVLDECMGALSTGLLDADLLREFIPQKPPALELVMTGRNPPEDLVAIADYVSEIKKIKHPYDRGISARCGFDK